MNIADLQKKVHRIAEDKGWWDEERTFGDLIALIHSEASEALEEFRRGLAPDYYYPVITRKDGPPKPCGVPVELADIIIRVLDMAQHFGIDMEEVLTAKIAYNEDRTYRHGGKVL